MRACQATLASITWLIDASDYFARHVRHRLCGSPDWKLFTCQRRKGVHSDEPEDDNFSEKSVHYRLRILPFLPDVACSDLMQDDIL